MDSVDPIMGPFYVEWVESRAVIPAVKYGIVHKIVSWECYLFHQEYIK